METIIVFTSREAAGLEQVGGKAFSLIELTRRGFPVPPGFVLTVRFFDPWIAALQAAPAWAAWQVASAEELGQASAALQALCHDLAFMPEQRAGLARALAALQAAHGATLFAVRSSSPEEDLEGASFAGGYETTLGVTPAALEAAIRRSFASAFDERVYLYKRERGLAAGRPSP